MLAPRAAPRRRTPSTPGCAGPDSSRIPARAVSRPPWSPATGKTRVERPKRAKRPPIDCFYVYPTTSAQSTLNANLLVDKELTNVALSQASRFSQACRVFAPVYRQVTLAGILGRFPGADREEASRIAYSGVASAWREYMRRFNHGRGVVLIGHSQGSGMLKQLVQAKIDPKRSARRRLVSALLLGWESRFCPRARRGRGLQAHPRMQVGHADRAAWWRTPRSTSIPPGGSFFGRRRVLADRQAGCPLREPGRAGGTQACLPALLHGERVIRAAGRDRGVPVGEDPLGELPGPLPGALPQRRRLHLAPRRHDHRRLRHPPAARRRRPRPGGDSTSGT